MNKFNRVALIGKYKSPDIREPVLSLASFLQERGVEVVIDSLTAENIKATDYRAMSLEKIAISVQLAIVLGGDGTMLNIARTLAPSDVAIVGVNQGRLGFLTDLSIEQVTKSMQPILDGKYILEKRMLLEASVNKSDGNREGVLALNDVSINKGENGGLMELEVFIDGCFAYFLRADGLIITTPTGSTAYALSAGGPILHPSLNCIGLVPVSPHTLSNRPIILKQDSVLEVKVVKAMGGRVHFDSHSHCPVKEGDALQVKNARCPIRLLHPEGHDYYSILRQKLHWSDSL